MENGYGWKEKFLYLFASLGLLFILIIIFTRFSAKSQAGLAKLIMSDTGEDEFIKAYVTGTDCVVKRTK